MSRANKENLVRYTQNLKKYITTCISPLHGAVEKRVTTAIFDITTANTTITLKNLGDNVSIDWGDGTTNSSMNHTYTTTGTFTCKIYNLRVIGKEAFRECTALVSIVIGTGITWENHRQFYGCTSLKSVVIEEGATSIGYADDTSRQTFQNCTSLTSVKLPKSLTAICNSAFKGCTALTSIVIPRNVTEIGAGAFHDCPKLSIFCQAKSKLDGWDSIWNSSNCFTVWDAGNIIVDDGEL